MEELDYEDDPLTYSKTGIGGPPLNNPFKGNTMKAKKVEQEDNQPR